MSHVQSSTPPAPPARLALPASVQAACMAAVLIGAVTLAWSYRAGHAPLAWSAYLMGTFFALGLGVFGIAWIAMLYLTGATWSITMRRIPEAMTAWLLPGSLLALAVVLGAPTLYLWAHPETVEIDALLRHKAAFLNVRMFTTLVAGSLIVWIVFASLIVRRSYRQDRDGGLRHTQANRSLSGLFLVLFAITFSIVSFYLLLSLDAHWFSTMFAVLVFTDVVQTGAAFVAVVASLFVLSGRYGEFVTGHHLHSLGKLVFAWTGFWAYIYFCQFMLIWYANIPEETVYFLRRTENGWLPYFLALPVLKFAVPFLLLMPRRAKRSPAMLASVSSLILFAQFWELYLMVAPAIGHGGDAAHAHLPLVEFAATAGFVGLFTLVFGRSLAGHDPIPLRDPGIAECLHYQS